MKSYTDKDSYLESRPIEVIAGRWGSDTAQSFFIHTDLLKSRSIFFKNFLPNIVRANDTKAKEFDSYSTYHTSLYWRREKLSLTPVFEFPTESADAFENYVRLLYTAELPIQDLPAKPKADDDILSAWKEGLCDSVHHTCSALYKLYALCTRIGDHTSKRVLLVAFLEQASTLRSNGIVYRPDKFAIADVYDNTTAQDPLRMFLVDCYVYEGTSDWVYEAGEKSKHPPAFLADFMSVMLKQRATPDYASRLTDAKFYQDKLSVLEEGGGGEEVGGRRWGVSKCRRLSFDDEP